MYSFPKRYFSIMPKRGGIITEDVVADLSKCFTPRFSTCLKCKMMVLMRRETCAEDHDICYICRPDNRECILCYNLYQKSLNETGLHSCLAGRGSCQVKLCSLLMQEHEQVCEVGNIDCPLDTFSIVKCGWKGPFFFLRNHVRKEHPTLYIDKNSFECSDLGKNGAVVHAFGELFVYRKKMTDDGWSFTVFMIGTRSHSKDYIIEYELNNCAEEYYFITTFPCAGYVERKDIYKSPHKYFQLDHEIMEKFIMAGGMNLTVTIHPDSNFEDAPLDELCSQSTIEWSC